MRNLAALLWLLTVCINAAPACAATPVDTFAAVQNKGVLVAGVRPATPPSATVTRRRMPLSVTTSTS